jgi:hypothetical protein
VKRLLPLLFVIAACLVLRVDPGHAAGANSPAAVRAADRPPQPPDSTPTLPPEVTPIDRFRTLLQLSPDQREAELARRNPAQREYLRARLQEFDQLAPRERELRLEALTLRHYLLPLLRADATNRVTGLQAVPLAYRDLVRARLTVWDRLDHDQRRAMLESESIFAGLAYVTTPDGLAAGERALDQLTTGRLGRLEADLARWRALSPEERSRVTAQFKAFLTLTETEKQKALAGLKDDHRQKAARLVEQLDRLTPEQRVKSIEAFARFSALPPAEQHRFLRNATRWRAMTAEERSAWRRLVAQAPPTPPGLPRRTSAEAIPPPAPVGLPPVPKLSDRPERPR